MENRVRELRIRKNISAKKLANNAGVSLSMIYQIEREEKIPSLKVAQKISDTLEENTDNVFICQKKEDNNV
ncbi:MAG: helix-turn-helix transcriptional regulator [Halanaerobiales bacterium]